MEASAHDHCRWLCVSALALTVCASSGVARARSADPDWTCGESGRPWVVVDFTGPGWDEAQRRGIRADLAAGLRMHGMLVCAPQSNGGAQPLARVQLEAAAMERVSVVIEVHDSLTNKHVLREIDLQSVPQDARGVALAAAAEELLRASWAELALEDAPVAAREPPAEVLDVVQLTAVVLPRHPRALGIRASAEYYGGGLTLLGADAWFCVWLGESIATEFAVGYRRGLDVSAEHGTIESQGLAVSVDLLYALAGARSSVSLLARLGVQGSSLEYDGRPEAGASGDDLRGFGVSARAALTLRLALSDDLDFRVEAGPGLALRGVAAVDTDDVVASTSGVLGHAALSLGAVF